MVLVIAAISLRSDVDDAKETLLDVSNPSIKLLLGVIESCHIYLINYG